MAPNSAPGDLTTKRKRAILLGNLTVFMFIVFCVMALGFLLLSTWYDAQTKAEILDCTEPTGECYQQGESRMKGVVDQVLQDGIDRETVTRRVVIIAALCSEDPAIRDIADQSQRITAMERCVNREINERTD